MFSVVRPVYLLCWCTNAHWQLSQFVSLENVLWEGLSICTLSEAVKRWSGYNNLNQCPCYSCYIDESSLPLKQYRSAALTS